MEPRPSRKQLLFHNQSPGPNPPQFEQLCGCHLCPGRRLRGKLLQMQILRAHPHRFWVSRCGMGSEPHFHRTPESPQLTPGLTLNRAFPPTSQPPSLQPICISQRGTELQEGQLFLQSVISMAHELSLNPRGIVLLAK